MRSLYPPLDPYNTGFLETDSIHQVYYEESGNPKGKPVLFLHGGPGSGCDPYHRRFFDPAVYRIVLIDQRGAGKSTPFAELRENTTWHLIADIEALRKKLHIDAWLVFGGSWGSTLALTYAIRHPSVTLGLILRGIFLVRNQDISWFYRKEGASRLFPDSWEDFLAPLTEEERQDPFAFYCKHLFNNEDPKLYEYALAWSTWEGAALCLIPDPEVTHDFASKERVLSLARIEAHYFHNKAFFPEEDWILRNAYKIEHLPCTIVHGRYDIICPLDNAWDLKKKLPKAKLVIVPDAGHMAKEPGILDALITATDGFR